MSKLVGATFASVYIGEIKTCSYKPNFTQVLAQIETKQESVSQSFYVELSRLAEFMDFIGARYILDIEIARKLYLVEKGRKRIKSIIKPADNVLGYERFIINNVFDNGLPFDYPSKNGG
jgi:hypothetical protein